MRLHLLWWRYYIMPCNDTAYVTVKMDPVYSFFRGEYFSQCGVTISTRVQSQGSREHSIEVWCVVLPIKYESYTTMSKVYLFCMSASATAHLLVHICSLPLVHRPKGVLLVISTFPASSQLLRRQTSSNLRLSRFRRSMFIFSEYLHDQSLAFHLFFHCLIRKCCF